MNLTRTCKVAHCGSENTENYNKYVQISISDRDQRISLTTTGFCDFYMTQKYVQFTQENLSTKAM